MVSITIFGLVVEQVAPEDGRRTLGCKPTSQKVYREFYSTLYYMEYVNGNSSMVAIETNLSLEAW